jgi:hypothetical protein
MTYEPKAYIEIFRTESRFHCSRVSTHLQLINIIIIKSFVPYMQYRNTTVLTKIN